MENMFDAEDDITLDQVLKKIVDAHPIPITVKGCFSSFDWDNNNELCWKQISYLVLEKLIEKKGPEVICTEYGVRVEKNGGIVYHEAEKRKAENEAFERNALEKKSLQAAIEYSEKSMTLAKRSNAISIISVIIAAISVLIALCKE